MLLPECKEGAFRLQINWGFRPGQEIVVRLQPFSSHQIAEGFLIFALHRLIAATLAVGLWPYLVSGLGRFIEYLNGIPTYQGPDDFWPAVWYFRSFAACSIILVWAVRWVTNRLFVKYEIISSYILVYASFVAIFFAGEKYSDFASVTSALHGGLLPISMIFIYDLFYCVATKVLSRLSRKSDVARIKRPGTETEAG